MIIIQPHSGLANRIRVIISGLNLSAKKNESVIILWNKDDSLFCNFTDIFELNKNFKLLNITLFARVFNFIRSRQILKKVFFKIFRIINYITDSDIPSLVWSTGTNNIDFNKISDKAGNTYIYTCHEFYFDSYFLKFLKPAQAIRKRIENNVSLFTNNTIGIHIRRTDHIEAIDNSPIELFVNAIEKECLKNINTNFYLATDDLQTEIFLKDKFGDKILTAKKDFSRVSKDGIKGAMIDLYSLAATKKIYGSFYSSFSDIASRIGNIPLEIIKK
jgi:hypothetical protein